jgi:hypothetical protein
MTTYHVEIQNTHSGVIETIDVKAFDWYDAGMKVGFLLMAKRGAEVGDYRTLNTTC